MTNRLAALTIALLAAIPARAENACQALFARSRSEQVFQELVKLRLAIEDAYDGGRENLARTLYTSFRERYRDAGNLKIDLTLFEYELERAKQRSRVPEEQRRERAREAEKDLFEPWRPVRVMETSGSGNVINYSPDGTRVLMSSFEGARAVWDLSTGKKLFELPPPGAIPATEAIYSTDGTRIITREMNELLIWDATNGALISKTTHPYLIEVNADATLAITKDKEGHAVRDLTAGTEFSKFSIKTFLYPSPKLTPDGRHVLLTEINHLDIIDSRTGQLVRRIPAPQYGFGNVGMSADGRLIATSVNGGDVVLWDFATGNQLAVLKAHTENISRLSFSADGSRLVTLSPHNNQIVLWEVSSGEKLFEYKGHSLHRNQLGDARLSADGKTLATVSNDGTFVIWRK